MIDFDGIYRRYWPDVFRFALYLCGNAADAEDLTAEAFLRAWMSTQPIRVGTVKAYLFMIVRNLHRDRLRRKIRQEKLDDASCDPKPGPEKTAGDRNEVQKVLDAMQKIPEADRAVLVMAAVNQMPHEGVAAALRLSIGAVKVRIHRARLKLSAVLQMEKPRNEL
jgi:RNA polymerase sigma-70 factor (ECF subfamily)